MRSIVLMLVALSVSGCSTTPISKTEAIAVPTERIASPVFLRPDAVRTEAVTITRDRGFTGGGVKFEVSANTDKIAVLAPGETVTFYLAPGRYVFVAAGIPNVFNEPPGETEVVISSELPNSFRLRLVSGDGPRFERTIQP